MKKIIFALALIAVSLVSCEKDDVQTTNDKAVETTKVNFTVSSAQQSVSSTGKLADKNLVPLYVDNLTINAVSPYPASNVSDTFTFGTGVGAATGFGLGNVALGTNVFNATSTSAAANKKLGFQNPNIGSSGQDGLTVMKADTPYITCASAPVQAVIVKGTNAPINLAMDTNNGRILAKFVQETPDADNYTVKITATQGSFTQTETLGAFTNGSKYFAWTNENAVTGAPITFTMNIYEKTLPNGTQGPLLNTIVKTITIQKAKNIMATFTIKNTDVHTEIADGGIVLTFPTITDVIIND